MRTKDGIKIRKNKKLYYPYCGYKVGFCLAVSGCHHTETNGAGCSKYRYRHPITNCPPQSLRQE